MNAMTGLAVLILLGPASFGADAATYRECARVAAESGGCGFLYAPLMALAARPLTWVSPWAAGVVMTFIGLAVLATAVTFETRGRANSDRLLVGLAALGFAPVVYDLLLGQVTLLIAGAIYVVARRTDGFRNGIPLGIVLALAPKPLLGPVLVWMLVWRRRGLGGAFVTAVALTGVGLLIAGPDAYRQWLGVLTGVGTASVSGTFALSLSGSFSLWPLDQMRLVIAVGVAAATGWAILRDPSRGFVCALLAGLLLAPYTGLYAAAFLLLAVTPALAFSPRATRALALIANPVIALALGLVAWCIVALVACVPHKLGHEPHPAVLHSADARAIPDHRAARLQRGVPAWPCPG